MTLGRWFLALGLTPIVALLALALLGARSEVSIVISGAGNAALGSAWIATWLLCVVLSPIALLAALFVRVWDRLCALNAETKTSCSSVR